MDGEGKNQGFPFCLELGCGFDFFLTEEHIRRKRKNNITEILVL
jgi:hypothetical protein